jgi:hypothetical protein
MDPQIQPHTNDVYAQSIRNYILDTCYWINDRVLVNTSEYSGDRSDELATYISGFILAFSQLERMIALAKVIESDEEVYKLSNAIIELYYNLTDIILGKKIADIAQELRSRLTMSTQKNGANDATLYNSATEYILEHCRPKTEPFNDITINNYLLTTLEEFRKFQNEYWSSK